MTPDTKRILLTGGGSGGHVYPLIAVAKKLKQIAENKKINLEINYLGPSNVYSGLVKNTGVSVGYVPAGKIRRYLSLLTLIDIPMFFIGLIVAFFKVFAIMPDVIFSKGGTGALPVVIAGWFYGIPTIIHESDASPGLNNLASAYFVSRIAVSFESAIKYFNPKKVAWTGTPVRDEILTDRISKEDAKENLGFNKNEPLILILEGSLGSERINKFILSNFEVIVGEAQVLHQAGEKNYAEVEKLSRAALSGLPAKIVAKTRYKAVSYLKEDLKTALSAADLVVSRAGSGTIFEVSSFGKPMILIPLRESANGHQQANAYEFARDGGAVVIEEANLLPAIFMAQIKTILGNADTMNKMSSASANFFKPGAAEVIAQELLKLAER